MSLIKCNICLNGLVNIFFWGEVNEEWEGWGRSEVLVEVFF